MISSGIKYKLELIDVFIHSRKVRIKVTKLQPYDEDPIAEDLILSIGEEVCLES